MLVPGDANQFNSIYPIPRVYVSIGKIGRIESNLVSNGAFSFVDNFSLRQILEHMIKLRICRTYMIPFFMFLMLVLMFMVLEEFQEQINDLKLC